MILIDYSQLMIASVMQQFYGDSPVEEISVDLLRHMTWKNLLFYRKKFKEDFGEVVICCDSKNVWRKKEFEYYKLRRKTNKAKSKFDWVAIYDSIDTIIADTKSHLPYKVMQIDELEADDIIAILIKNLQQEKNIILSSDEDYIQLQKYTGVQQFSPIKKRFLISDDPEKDLLCKILKGDEGDGVPNVRSDSDTFSVAGKRQSPMTQKRMDELLALGRKGITEDNCEWKNNFLRNQLLIDFDLIPYRFTEIVLNRFNALEVPSRKELLAYLHKMQLRELSSMYYDF